MDIILSIFLLFTFLLGLTFFFTACAGGLKGEGFVFLFLSGVFILSSMYVSDELLVDLFIVLLFICGCLIFFLSIMSTVKRKLWFGFEGGIVGFFLGFVVLLISTFIIADSYIGNHWIEGKVVNVYKGSTEQLSDEVSVNLKGSLEFKSEKIVENNILHDYEVAVFIGSSKELSILTNNNDLFRWKFNKRAIQLHLEPEKKFKLLVYGFLGKKNILKAIQK